MSNALYWHRAVADRTLAAMAQKEEEPPTLFPMTGTPDCFVLHEKGYCEECQCWVEEIHCPTVALGFHCPRHCPVCGGSNARA